MLSFIIQTSLGCLFIVGGIFTIVKKWEWLWLPIIGKKEIAVDIIKYTKFMGITIVVLGLLFILIAILEFAIEIKLPSWIYILTLLIYQGLTVFDKIKYKNKLYDET